MKPLWSPPPVLTETKPPAWMMLSKAARSVTKFLTTGNGRARFRTGWR
jgi:hypothetical protein